MLKPEDFHDNLYYKCRGCEAYATGKKWKETEGEFYAEDCCMGDHFYVRCPHCGELHDLTFQWNWPSIVVP